MSVDELLLPRYKSVADFPGNILPIGHITTLKGTARAIKSSMEFFDKYPHLFQPIEWWEERKPEEMPEYVKEINSLYKIGEVIKVAEWEMESEDTDVPCFRDQKDNHFTWVRGFVPATLEDYTEYLTQATPNE